MEVSIKKPYLFKDVMSKANKIEDIMFNRKTSQVAMFKDYLIADDYNDYMITTDSGRQVSAASTHQSIFL